MDPTSHNKELLGERCSKIQKVMNSLKKTSFKKNVLEECSEYFHIDKFEELLDTKTNLIGFEKSY